MHTIVRILKTLRLYRLAVFILNLYFTSTFKKRIDYWGYHILRADEGSDLITQLLESAEPVSIAKLGSIETEAIHWFSKHEGKSEEWPLLIKSTLYRNAGVFPTDDEVLAKWCLEFTDSIKSLDLIGLLGNPIIWPYEAWAVRRFALNARLFVVGGLEWQTQKNPWTRALKDKRVLVIHPFEQTIRRQFPQMDRIYQDELRLPHFELDTVKVPLSDALVKSSYKDWFDALEHMKTEIAKKEFDVAIVGAGAYSIPLVAYVKKRGKCGIHLGGQTQLLFGIKGGRWDKFPAMSRFYNSYWCRPSKEETPENVSILEDGCYW